MGGEVRKHGFGVEFEEADGAGWEGDDGGVIFRAGNAVRFQLRESQSFGDLDLSAADGDSSDRTAAFLCEVARCPAQATADVEYCAVFRK